MSENSHPLSREEEIQQIRKEYPLMFPITGVIGIILFLTLLGFRLFAGSNDFAMNLYNSVIDITITVGLIEVLNRHRDAKNSERDLQEQLVREAGSRVNGTALTAIDMMRKRGWLRKDKFVDRYNVTHAISLLENKDLRFANLESGDLQAVDLTNSMLYEINLNNTNLSDAILNRALLHKAKINGSQLFNVNLANANLSKASMQNSTIVQGDFSNSILEGADFTYSILRKADLSNANLTNATLKDALIDEANFSNAIMPDGSRYTTIYDLRDKFGAEIRVVRNIMEISSTEYKYTFSDGQSRKWVLGKGFLD